MLLDADCTARLADFGYASLVANIPKALACLQKSTTRLGTLRWIAPEQLNQEVTFSRTTKTDIYSFGCVTLEGGLLHPDARPMLTPLQVLSGKRPWSEVAQDSAVVLRLAQGHTPDRPQCRRLNDSHWSLIQHCWSPMEERPAVVAIIPTIQEFLSSCPRSPPLCDLLPSWSGQADLGAESSSSLSQALTEDSRTHVTPLHSLHPAMSTVNDPRSNGIRRKRDDRRTDVIKLLILNKDFSRDQISVPQALRPFLGLPSGPLLPSRGLQTVGLLGVLFASQVPPTSNLPNSWIAKSGLSSTNLPW